MNISNLILNKKLNINHIEKFKELLTKKTLLDVTSSLVKNPNTKIFRKSQKYYNLLFEKRILLYQSRLI